MFGSQNKVTEVKRDSYVLGIKDTVVNLSRTSRSGGSGDVATNNSTTLVISAKSRV